jgi:HTH-type transcriptional regulator/antitoxin HigA
MEPKVIKSKEEYEKAFAEVERLMALNPAPGTKEADRLDLFATLVEKFEKEHFPIEKPTPIEAITFRMEEQGLKQRDLVPYIGSKSKVSEILSGKRPLTLEMIRALHEGLGIPTEVLVQKREPEAPKSGDIDWNRFPVREMIKRNWIIANLNEVRVRGSELAKAFFAELGNGGPVPAFYRRSIHERSGRTMDSYALRAWAARVLIQSRQAEGVKSYKQGSVTPDFMQELTRLSLHARGPVQAKEFLAHNGIILVVESHLPGTRLDGAAMLGQKGNPVIGLSVRYDRIDNFWFTLLHELAHVTLHLTEGYEEVFVDDLDAPQDDDPKEREADRLAGNVLIPRSVWKRSRAYLQRTQAAVEELAQELKIHPAIVAGRIRSETNNYQALSHLVGHGQVRKFFPDVRWQ